MITKRHVAPGPYRIARNIISTGGGGMCRPSRRQSCVFKKYRSRGPFRGSGLLFHPLKLIGTGEADARNRTFR